MSIDVTYATQIRNETGKFAAWFPNAHIRIRRWKRGPLTAGPLIHYAAGVTKSSRIRKAADEPFSTRQSRMKRTASRRPASRLSSSGRP
jgi:hypothetical protein